LKTVFLNDALHAPGADCEPGLTELLGDDIDRSIGIEEAMADDLPFDFISADGIGFGPAFLAEKRCNALLLE
jgi:hypothetical protein